MTLIILSALLVIAGAIAAVADSWALRDSDRVLSRAEVDALTQGRTIEFYDDGQSRYFEDGGYSYTYASGAQAFGRYSIADDGTVCIEYRNGFDRCDRYVEAGGRIVLLTEDGLRFPIRPAAQ